MTPPPQADGSVEEMTTQLRTHLAPYSEYLDLDRMYVQEAEGFGRTIHFATIPVMDPDQRGNPAYLMIPVGSYPRHRSLWFTVGQGQSHETYFVPVLGPRVQGQIEIQVLEWVTSTASTAEERKDAKVMRDFQANLMARGYMWRRFSVMGVVEIAKIEGKAPELVAFGFVGPFTMDENWMSQWSDIPPEMRQVLLESYDRDEFVLSMVSRMQREIQRRENWLPGAYISFVADWNLLPEDYRQDALIMLDASMPAGQIPFGFPRLSDIWSQMAMSQEVAEGVPVALSSVPAEG